MPRFGKPQASTYFKPGDHGGALVIFEPLGLVKDYVFPGSKDPARDAYRCNVFVVEGPAGPQKYFEQTVTQSVLVNAMRGTEDQYLLGRLEMGDRAWLLRAGTAADEEKAGTFLDNIEGTSAPGTAPSSSPAPAGDVPF